MKNKKIESIKFEEVPELWKDRCSGDGYNTYIDENGKRIYSDNNIPVDKLGYRPCAKCGKYPSPDGDDACISNLGRVTNACCGHGNNEGYIQFDNGITIRGYFKVENSNKIDINYQIKSREAILDEIDRLEDSGINNERLNTLKWVMNIE